MWQRCGLALASICAAFAGILLAAAPAETSSRFAADGFVVDGGGPRERAQIEAALAASEFDWRVLPVTVHVHVRPGVRARATPGHVWLSSELLAAGKFSWPVVQHEFAHQVDFFLLDEPGRELLASILGGESWWGGADVPHQRRAAERFAETLVGAYWTGGGSRYRPRTALPPDRFRRLLELVLSAN